MARCYVRDGVWGWSIAEQLAALEAAGVLELGRLYMDKLHAHRAKKPAHISPDWLEQRNKDLLRASGREHNGEEIAVATITVLAPNEADLVNVIESAWARGATIRAIDSGVSIAPNAGVAGVTTALKDWQRSKAVARTKPGRTAGYIAAAEKKRADTSRKVKLARPFWNDTSPDRLSAQQISDQVELSLKTLYRELRMRPRVRRDNVNFYSRISMER